jgi:hypothetical protein
MLRYVQGEMPDVVESTEVVAVPAQAKVLPVDGLEYPYDVQYILKGEGLDLMTVR